MSFGTTTPGDLVRCKRCGTTANQKPFAFKGNNAWNHDKQMHVDCANAQAVEDAAQQGAAGLKTAEGQPTPTIPKPGKAFNPDETT
jgi:hypothetical protein